MANRRPFHETIVDTIREMTPVNIPLVARLIMATKIPRGHDEIIAAWKEQETYLRENGFSLKGNPQSLFDDIEEQKQEAMAEGKPKNGLKEMPLN